MSAAGLAYPGTLHPDAEVAELVDALASGASGGNPVEVQVLSSVPYWRKNTHGSDNFSGSRFCIPTIPIPQ